MATPSNLIKNDLIDFMSDVYDDRIKPSNPQLTIRLLCPNPDGCALIKLIYEILRSLNACRRHRSNTTLRCTEM
ncbi:hypothetical protein [Nostoc sp. PCC 9305]|uniref:hypothetical protein n=1 Tax=Nostoc sp. PCC 9305 TaxID=296636 RepID=UPI0039C704C2